MIGLQGWNLCLETPRVIHKGDNYMKRYTIERDQFYALVPEEDPKGEWVRYEDIGALIKANKSLECNCFHMAAELKESVWICPAHGYKRL